MAAVASVPVTTTQVAGISFGFYSPDEVSKLSVKQIVSPISLDAMSNALPGGLYDPSMGPVDQQATCTTCGLRFSQCLGHFGHLQLSVPVLHPLTFPTMLKLMKCLCLHCYCFRMPQALVDRFCTRLKLLAEGRLVEALQHTLAVPADKGDNDDVMEDDAHPGPQLFSAKDAQQRLPSAGGRRRDASTATTSHTLAATQATVAEFFSRMPQKCGRCGAVTPTIKRQGGCRMFQKGLNSKDLEANQSRGTVVSNPLQRQGCEHSTENEEQLGEGARQEDKAKRRSAAELDELDEPLGLQDDDKRDADGPDRHIKAQSKQDRDMRDPKGPDAEDVEAETDSSAARLRFMSPAEIKEIMKRAWEANADILDLIYTTHAAANPLSRKAKTLAKRALGPATLVQRGASHEMFFLQRLLVSPNRTRPPQRLGGALFEHPHNVSLAKIINTNLDLLASRQRAGVLNEPQEASSEVADLAAAKQAEMLRSLRLWLQLQDSVNGLLDSTTVQARTISTPGGIRQTLEKKEGLFRKNMMGKRVNFACRSVISPDPYLGTGEIGIPPYFAMRLSYPERVTAHNVQELRHAVMKGPNDHPGAVAVENERGQIVSLSRLEPRRREAIAKQLLSFGTENKGMMPGQSAHQGGKIVYRHLRNGDVMLTNRQPTLHKPGMMAHRARVLKGERTIRMHYANCATFNADFDGDEINLHLPQDSLARAEGYGIVHADHQFHVPTDGKPVRGLIQDHVVGGTLLTKRDTFLTRSQTMQLIYAACTATQAWQRDKAELICPSPAIWRPTPLWTGKQVMTAVLEHFTRGEAPLTLFAGSKVGAEYWGQGSEELQLHVFKGYLCTGCMDKAQYGRHGLLHSVQELYGNQTAALFTGALSRLLTTYLQLHGFSCGMDDLLLQASANRTRVELLGGAEAAAQAASAKLAEDRDQSQREDNPEAHVAHTRTVLAQRYRVNPQTGAAHDVACVAALQPIASSVVKACLPDGQAKPFPGNYFSAMTATGAKGSLVNFSQISCLLGQQELEGRRVPRMLTGKTLPCFAAFDGGARSGGFIGDRFLSGLQPQEYYFHCMAGREGLVDTTVKTSRSGYLQRCLVKNLEPLRVHYDHTVRDDCDGTVVQFLYGEDGLDVTQEAFVRQFGFQARNAARVAKALDLRGAQSAPHDAPAEALAAKANRVRQKARGKGKPPPAALPVSGQLPPSCLGATSEAFADALADFVRTDPEPALAASAAAARGKKRKKTALEAAPEDPRANFERLMDLKFLQSQIAPGEAVGVLAAQSVGEPSTQMTLNTFHMAGRGEANVTLGIPRLREILMTAAASIKLPVMTVPLHPRCTPADAKRLSTRLSRISLAQAVRAMSVQEAACRSSEAVRHGWAREFLVTLRVFQDLPEELELPMGQVYSTFRDVFVPKLKLAVERELKNSKTAGSAGSVAIGAVRGEDGEAAQDTPAAARAKVSEKGDEDENEEANEEDREGKLRFAGGRREAATYDEGDAEDKELRAHALEEEGSSDDDQEAPDKPSAGQDGPEGQPEPSRPAVRRDNLASPDQQASREEVEEEEQTPAARGRKRRIKASVGGAAGEDTEEGFGDVRINEETGTCEVLLLLPILAPKILMMRIVERVAAATMIRQTPGIERCYVLEGDPPKLQTDGMNLTGMADHADLADLHRLETNDISATLRFLGVEAARAALVREVRAVFGAYGIAIDARHLSLIADFMTSQGGYRACNRLGIQTSTSAFLKITFETAATFLMQATLAGSHDSLDSPAARIVAGHAVQLGTGSFDLLHTL